VEKTMNQPTKRSDDDPARHGGNLMDEADIGSGGKTPGELETDEHIKTIPPLPPESERGKPERQHKPPGRQ
jgi:hypothetical protein